MHTNLHLISPFTSDHDVLSDLLNERVGGYEKFKSKYFSMIHALVYRNSGTQTDAEDLFQESLWVLLENLRKPEFRLSCQLSTYLYAVAKRIWLKQLNYNQKSKLYIEHEAATEGIELEITETEAHEKNLTRLNKAFDRLGSPCAELIKDYYINGFTMEKLAGKWHYTNTDTAKTQKYKCLQRLRKLFFETP